MTAARDVRRQPDCFFADERKGTMNRMFAAGALSVAVVAAAIVAANAAGTLPGLKGAPGCLWPACPISLFRARSACQNREASS